MENALGDTSAESCDQSTVTVRSIFKTPIMLGRRHTGSSEFVPRDTTLNRQELHHYIVCTRGDTQGRVRLDIYMYICIHVLYIIDTLYLTLYIDIGREANGNSKPCNVSRARRNIIIYYLARSVSQYTVSDVFQNISIATHTHVAERVHGTVFRARTRR